jgi:GrpB-like predicted nucleotidyltransferase (UPF0157 family)
MKVSASVVGVPFPDESVIAAPVPYRDRWPDDFAVIVAGLRKTLGGIARAIDHVGSTSIPGMPAKDCVDVQIRVDAIDHAAIVPPLSAIGYRLRTEAWNTVETSFGVTGPKLVFAPAVGARTANVHVRVLGSSQARFALLFRDYLRSDTIAREAWGEFKTRLADGVPDLFAYGRIKQPATAVLMRAAERWAADTGWEPPR